MKLYDFETEFDFGQCKGQKLKDVFVKSPSYINWCFQKVDWFCITDEIFNQLPIILALRRRNEIDNVSKQKDWLKILTEKHHIKQQQLQKQTSNINTIEIEDNFVETDLENNDNLPFRLFDPRYDNIENPWIDVFGEGEEAETAYWNTD